ncbi:hypothetical protein CN692_06130 [Bacillus sp. AFS002410]|uniref:HEAT repeat domain-containing protein n=1 Tax=Bacillus sp. AFS002410 TaxID=2033481 RepID=UPI000BEF3A44|nr:hypothetical protein [Bacillus sp. AFS002410]PEJ59054.1 hypothetical protein CN692_06130 [Bacillus sp. AFS002410]
MNIFIILYITGFLFLLLCSIYIYLVFNKIIKQHKNKQKEEWLNRNIVFIESYLIKGELSASFIPKKEIEFEALENIFSSFMSIIKFEEGFDPIRPIVNLYFIPRYKYKLKHGNWSERMNSLLFIKQFNIKMMQADLIQHLSNKKCSLEEKFDIFLILASFKYDKLMELLVSQIKIPSFLLTEILDLHVNEENIHELLKEFDHLPESYKNSILDLIRIKHFRSEQIYFFLEKLITSENSELRIRSLKTIASLGYISSPNLITQLVESYKNEGHPDTQLSNEEKLMIARLMGNIRYDLFLSYLTELISDKAYIVRSEAAKSIKKYKKGRVVLNQINEEHPDAYARNISKEWLERTPEYD